MRKEYVVYERNLPINMELLDIRNYPLAWQDSTRIFFVLEGSISIEIGNESFNLHPRELEIVNKGEIYSVQGQEENRVLILDIAPNFFQQYLDGVENIYYYTDSLDGSPQKDYRYRRLREYIAILYYEFIQREGKYEEKIEKLLLETMYHLLNNFHHLYYEEESLREDELQFERFSRIINYLRENYNERVSLSEIAEKEYLTSQYLSYKIKDTFGQSFNDFLNQIRVEESRKLLLDGDKSISEIALESGFSHSRYYNKHFKKIYGVSPTSYREIHRKTRDEIEAEKEVYSHSLEEALDYMEPYLFNYEEYRRSRGIVRRSLDLEAKIIAEKKDLDAIILDDPFLLLDEKYRREFSWIVSRLGISRVFLFGDIFEKILEPYQLLARRSEIERLIKILSNLDLNLIIGLENIRIQEDLRRVFRSLDSELKIDFFSADQLEREYFIPVEANDINDSLELNSILFNKLFFQNKKFMARFQDRIPRSVELETDSFHGSNGLLTLTGLRKPVYYGYFMVNTMSREIIHKEEGLIVARSENSFQVLAYDPGPISRGEIFPARSLSLNILGLREDYMMTSYSLNKNSGSVYDLWMGLGKPEILDKDDLLNMQDLSRPLISYRSLEKVNVFNLVHSLDFGETILWDFRKLSSINTSLISWENG